MTRSEAFRAGVLTAKGSLSPGESVLVDEACRLIDRLDIFDALITGDRSEWLTIDWPSEDQPARLVISSAIGEARQTVSELRQVVKAIEGAKAKGAKEDAGPTKLQVLLGGAG